MDLKPGWLERQSHEIIIDIATWPDWQRLAAGFGDDDLTHAQKIEAAKRLRARADELHVLPFEDLTAQLKDTDESLEQAVAMASAHAGEILALTAQLAEMAMLNKHHIADLEENQVSYRESQVENESLAAQLAERDRAIAGAREALLPFADKTVFFPNDPPRLVDIGTSIRELQRVDDALAALPPTPEKDEREQYWLIYFSDQDVRPEIYTDEESARLAFKKLSDSWTCRLFTEALPPTPQQESHDEA